MNWLQLRFDFDSSPFDYYSTQFACHSTAEQRPIDCDATSNDSRTAVE